VFPFALSTGGHGHLPFNFPPSNVRVFCTRHCLFFPSAHFSETRPRFTHFFFFRFDLEIVCATPPLTHYLGGSLSPLFAPVSPSLLLRIALLAFDPFPPPFRGIRFASPSIRHPLPPPTLPPLIFGVFFHAWSCRQYPLFFSPFLSFFHVLPPFSFLFFLPFVAGCKLFPF